MDGLEEFIGRFRRVAITDDGRREGQIEMQAYTVSQLNRMTRIWSLKAMNSSWSARNMKGGCCWRSCPAGLCSQAALFCDLPLRSKSKLSKYSYDRQRMMEC